MNIIYKVSTNKVFNQAVADLKKNLANYGFGVLWELNFKDKLKEKNLSFKTNFKILEVCNPAKANAVLELDINAGYLLPCKMAIYDDDGYIYIGMLKPSHLMELIENEELIQLSKDIEVDLISAINDSK